MNFLLSALLSLTVSLVSAQEYNTSAPFALKLDSTVANISGQYLGACHSGAAIEQLCLIGTDFPTDTNYGTYALNVSVYSEATPETGVLVWSLPVGTTNVSSGLHFDQVDLDSNVDVVLFEPSSSSDSVGFDADDKLFVSSNYPDQSTFEPGVYPTAVTPGPLYHVSFSSFHPLV